MTVSKFLHILNPNQDHRKAVRKYSLKNSYLPHVWVERTSHPTHLETVVEWGLNQGMTSLAVWGGDGSFNRVVQELFSRGLLSQCKLALLPVGTGNDFARKLKFPGWKKLNKILFTDESREEKFDVGVVDQNHQKRIFMNNAGFGRTGTQLENNHPNPLKDIFSFTEKKIEVECDDGSVRHFETMRVFFGLVFNSPYFNKGLYFDKKISSVDGLLKAIMVPPQNKWKLLFRFIRGQLGQSLSDRQDRTMEGKNFRVESDQFLFPQVDGEPIGKSGVHSLQFSILEKALSLRVPKMVNT